MNTGRGIDDIGSPAGSPPSAMSPSFEEGENGIEEKVSVAGVRMATSSCDQRQARRFATVPTSGYSKMM